MISDHEKPLLQFVEAGDPGDWQAELNPESTVLKTWISCQEHRVKLCSLDVVDVRVAGLHVRTDFFTLTLYLYI